MTSIPNFPKPGFARPVRRGGAAAAVPGAGRERLWLPVAVVVAAIVGLAGWMLLVSPVRDDAAALDTQATAVTQQVDALRTQLTTLQADQAKLPQYKAELQAAQAALPNTAALPAFLRTLQTLGTVTGTTVTGLTATAPDGTTVAAGSTGIGNVYRVPVTVTVTGSYPGLTAFVANLQDKQPRAVLVTSVNATGSSATDITLTIIMSAFVAPTAGATANGG